MTAQMLQELLSVAMVVTGVSIAVAAAWTVYVRHLELPTSTRGLFQVGTWLGAVTAFAGAIVAHGDADIASGLLSGATLLVAMFGLGSAAAVPLSSPAPRTRRSGRRFRAADVRYVQRWLYLVLAVSSLVLVLSVIVVVRQAG